MPSFRRTSIGTEICPCAVSLDRAIAIINITRVMEKRLLVGEFEEKLRLFARYLWRTLEEIFDGVAMLQVIKQYLHGHPGASEAGSPLMRSEFDPHDLIQPFPCRAIIA